MLKEKGQSLLEVTVAIGVAVVIITALTIITITGLRNSQFAQDQSQATKLAQDWLEQVRSIRDRDGLVTITNGSNSPWSQSQWNNCGQIGGCKFSLGTVNNGVCVPSSNPTTVCLYSPAAPQPITGTIFTRVLTIRDCNSKSGTPDPDPECNGKQRKITTTVSWTDSSGTHQSNLVTILAN